VDVAPAGQPGEAPAGQPGVAPAGQPGAVPAGSQQEELDRQAALALQQYYATRRPVAAQTATGRLNLTIAQAKLTKNYGLTRMDPYVRLRLGHCVYETQTAYNGATNPRWNKAVMCYVPHGVTSLHLEVYDECSFSEDALVAQANIKPLAAGEVQMPAPGTVPLVMAPQAMVGVMPTMGVPMYGLPVQQQQQQQQYQPPPVSDEDVKQLKEMFPAMDDDIIRSVLVSRSGDKAAAITSLLELTET